MAKPTLSTHLSLERVVPVMRLARRGDFGVQILYWIYIGFVTLSRAEKREEDEEAIPSKAFALILF